MVPEDQEILRAALQIQGLPPSSAAQFFAMVYRCTIVQVPVFVGKAVRARDRQPVCVIPVPQVDPLRRDRLRIAESNRCLRSDRKRGISP